MTLKLLDTFAGIGGFSYAAEQLVGGFKTTQFVEIEPYCQKILKKHWPNVPIHNDIKTFTAKPFQFDCITGGFPCQDVSVAGQQRGITKETRSGLFYELIRIIRMVRPKYVLLENVAALLNNGMGIVLGELSKIGYDAEWKVISARERGACHLRQRVWIIAYPNSIRCRGGSIQRRSIQERKLLQREQTGSEKGSEAERCSINTSNPQSKGLERQNKLQNKGIRSIIARHSRSTTNTQHDGSSTTEKSRSIKKSDGRATQGENKACEFKGSSTPGNSRIVQHNERSANTKDIDSNVRKFGDNTKKKKREWQSGGCDSTDVTNSLHEGSQGFRGERELPEGGRKRQIIWRSQPHLLNPNWRGYISKPTICRGDDGLSSKLDASERINALKALGNSIVPQVATIPLGRILDLEKENQ